MRPVHTPVLRCVGTGNFLSHQFLIALSIESGSGRWLRIPGAPLLRHNHLIALRTAYQRQDKRGGLDDRVVALSCDEVKVNEAFGAFR